MPDEIYKDICPKTKLSSSDTYIDYLYCNSIQFNLPPAYTSATLERWYGKMDKPFQTISALDLENQYVDIVHPDTDEVIFKGIVVRQTDDVYNDVKGTDTTGNTTLIPTGTTFYQVQSADFELDRIFIDSSYFYGTSETGVYQVDRIHAFNGSTTGILEKNRTTSEITYGSISTCYFSQNQLELWTVYDMIRYLLFNFANNWTMDTSDTAVINALKNIKIQYNPAGKTVRECLCDLLSITRGFTWKVLFDDSSNPMITPLSISDVDISVDGTVTVPKNTNVVDFSTLIKDSPDVHRVKIERPSEALYQYIVIRSEPLRIMFTLDIGDTQLEPLWTTEEKDNYESASDETRRNETFDKVYQQFALTSDWNGRDWNSNKAIPLYNYSTQEYYFTAEPVAAWRFWTFDRTLPIPLNDDVDKTQYRKPFLLLKADGSSTYFVSDKTLEYARVGFRALDDQPGVEFKPRYNHYIALNNFTGSSDYSAVLDYSAGLVTVSAYSDAVLSIKYTSSTVTNGRTKQITIPGYHLWIGLKDTYTDADTVLTANTVYRDDRSKLHSLAGTAASWYSRDRNKIDLTCKGYFQAEGYTALHKYLGYIASQAYSGGSFIPAGTIINSIYYNFSGEESCSLSTDFLSLDFSIIGRSGHQTTTANLSRRLNHIEENLKQIPLRDAGSGNSTSSYDGPFKLVDSSETVEGTTTFKISVINGADESSASCGNYRNGLFYESVTKPEAITVTSSGVIYVEINYAESTFSFTFATASSTPASVSGAPRVEIGSFEIESGKMTITEQKEFSDLLTPGML